MTPEDKRQYQRQWYADNKAAQQARIQANNARYREENAAFVNRLKEESPCSDCGNYYPAICMDFDHVRGSKVKNIADMVKSAMSLKKILAEIAKCELVCANCHRIRTRDRQLGVG